MAPGMVPSGNGARAEDFWGNVSQARPATAATRAAVAVRNRFKSAGYRPAPFLSAAALSVFSQVNSGSVRPKWPNAAVFV